VIGALIAQLREQQNADGGWGASPRQASNTESTALALMALAATVPESTDARVRAERWLLSRQNADGSWRFTDDAPDASWATTLAVLALRGRVAAEGAARKALDWILEQKGAGISWRVRLREFLLRRQSVELDPSLDGWPWARGTFSWVEPTAYALLALKANWPEQRPPRVASRVREGEAMTLDRACPGGGWNYGNRRVLGEDLEPYADTTALALLALQGIRSDPAVEAGFRALQRLIDASSSGLALALAILCHRAWMRDAPRLRPLLEARFESTHFLAETRTFALAALAASDGPNPFIIPIRG
jgi:hypothetical protein